MTVWYVVLGSEIGAALEAERTGRGDASRSPAALGPPQLVGPTAPSLPKRSGRILPLARRCLSWP